MIKMILATDEAGGIGINNGIPWKCPADMTYFKEQTLNKPVFMGRSTFESLPFKDGLPNRQNFVLSSVVPKFDMLGYRKHSENVHFVNFNYAKAWAEIYPESWVIGGKSIYEQFIEHVDEIHHTTIAGKYGVDTTMDLTFLKEWECSEIKRLSDNAVLKIYHRR